MCITLHNKDIFCAIERRYMEKQAIKQILLDQREEIKKIFNIKIIEREIEEKVRESLRDNLIKVIIGVRRCGKSVLSHHLLKDKNYAYRRRHSKNY